MLSSMLFEVSFLTCLCHFAFFIQRGGFYPWETFIRQQFSGNQKMRKIFGSVFIFGRKEYVGDGFREW